MSDDIVERAHAALVTSSVNGPVIRELIAEIEALQLHIDEQDSEIDRLRAANREWADAAVKPDEIVEINCEHDWTRIDHNGDMLMWPICSECGEPMPPHMKAPTDE